MQTRKLGRSGVTVSRLCLGTMMFGGQADAPSSARMIARAREAGCNFIDTADVYVGGRSEEVVGEALTGSRASWVLATKLGNGVGSDPNARGLSRRWIVAATEASLRRLRTDHIDLMYLHREDASTPLEVTVAALGDLIRAGKLRAFGLSNFRAWRVAALVAVCDRLGVDRPVASQPLYNILNRQAELEELPVAAEFGLGVVPYSPLARGVLTGKYDPAGAPPADSRAGRGDKRMMEAEWRPDSLAIAQRIRAHAEANGSSAAHLAVQWVLYNPLVTSVIAGPRTEAQLADYLAAMEAPYGAAEEALVDGLVPAGHPSTPGHSDPQYPVEGRPTAMG